MSMFAQNEQREETGSTKKTKIQYKVGVDLGAIRNEQVKK